MFSGIITTVGIPKTIKKGKISMEIFFPIPSGWNITLGESINIDGVCSTVKKINFGIFSVYYMPETLKKTSLLSLNKNHVYNLERCITLETLISGHLVYGHIDTTAVVSKITQVQKSTLLEFTIDKAFTKYIVYKGSIAVNGVSLTVVSVTDSSFSVSLIPFTKEHTNLGQLAEKDRANIEVDMFAKYVEKLLKK